MVSFDKDDLTVEALDQIMCVTISGFPDQVAKDIYEVALADLCVPAANKLGIHLLDRGKWSAVKSKHIFVPEVQIACEEYLLQNQRLLYPSFLMFSLFWSISK